MIAGFLLIAANLRVALTSIGPLVETIRGDLHLTAGEAGFIGTLPLLTFAAVSPQVPRLTRRFGTDQMLWAALATLAAGIVARSLPVTGLLWVGTVLLGAAIAVGNVLMPSLIKRDFPDRVSAVTGVYTAVIGIMASVAAGVAVPLAGTLPGGWRTSLGCWAGLVLVGLAVWTPQITRQRGAAPAEPTKTATPWRSLLAWECAAFMALSACGFYTVQSWYSSILQSHGTSETTAGWLLFAYQFVGVIMSIVMPFVLARLRDQRGVAFVSALIAVSGYLGLLFLPDLAVLWVLLTGIGAGGVFFLALAFFSLRAEDPRSSAALSGMGQSVGYLVAAFGPVLFGYLHDVTGDWRVPLAVLAGLTGVHALIGLRAGRDAHVQV
ncbi:CP family cyanate transporter-like MFS transporter [Actinophytocola oryzae]|uniref:CP family cyanate transporter-like MFS transporter n=2 Tax=Actinophytocola oryzae TaxID=502181 RepID=A0A4R7VVA6_9PSEU|nr:CP family cyanate transporter-like MFS transporter [Actinophytocola oryzae]